MINFKLINRYCCEDISLIENYDKAVNDTETWDCHHRREIDENKSYQQLKAEGLYYHRPANELIFLTKSEHLSLHGKFLTGEKNPMYGKSPFDFMTHEAIEAYRKKQSEVQKISQNKPEVKKKKSNKLKGEKNPSYGKFGEKANCFGRCWMHNDIDTIYPKKEDVDKYIYLGYHFGRKYIRKYNQ